MCFSACLCLQWVSLCLVCFVKLVNVLLNLAVFYVFTAFFFQNVTYMLFNSMVSFLKLQCVDLS